MNAGMLKRILFGLLLIGFGLLFLASQLGFIHLDWGEIFPTFWPAILIFVGLSGMASSGRNQSGLFWNGFVALLGVVFLLRNLDILDMGLGDLFKLMIPAAIILYGLKLILGGDRGKPDKDGRDGGNQNENDSARDQMPPPPPPPPPPSVFDERDVKAEAGRTFAPEFDNGKAGGEQSAASAGWLHGSGIGESVGKASAGASGGSVGTGKEDRGAKSGHMGHFADGSAGANGHWSGNWNETRDGVETRSGFIGDIHVGRDYWVLKPMNINVFIGDTVIDLTKAQIPYGETKLTVSAFIGDVKVLVPNDSDLSFKVNSSSFIGDIRVFGRNTGGFLRAIDEQMPDYAEADKKIFLQCNLFIGDIQIMKVG